MNERLLKIMEYFNYSPSIFADEIGVIRSSISHIISGRNNPGLELLQKVLIRFPQISSDWLLLGRGEMMLSEEEQEKKRVTNVNQPRKIGQLNLDDFTRPAHNLATEQMAIPKPVAAQIPAENLQPNVAPLAQPPIQEKIPVNPTVTEQKPSILATVKTDGQRVSRVKRITLFYEDNSFQDFVENV